MLQKSRLKSLALWAATVLGLSIGAATLPGAASAVSHKKVEKTSTSAPENGESDSEEKDGAEGAADQKAQDEACNAAGVNPSADNIEYDDQTGNCTVGADDGADDATEAQENGAEKNEKDTDNVEHESQNESDDENEQGQQ